MNLFKKIRKIGCYCEQAIHRIVMDEIEEEYENEGN